MVYMKLIKYTLKYMYINTYSIRTCIVQFNAILKHFTFFTIKFVVIIRGGRDAYRQTTAGSLFSERNLETCNKSESVIDWGTINTFG